MNEVNVSKAAQFAVVGASSKGTVEARPQESGKDLPSEAVNEAQRNEPQVQRVSEDQLESEVAEVNDFVQSIQRDLQFTLDKELDRTVIKVTDSDSGEVIRQIPEDIFLELARRLKDDGEFRLLNALG